MPAKYCPNCLSTELQTDLSRGDVVCTQCFAIVEEGILVSEVGFAEGSGGRMHVQGTFVSYGATGFRGGGSESSENVKKQGHERIRLTGQQMNIPGSIWRQAQRYFTLAVDAKFNKGRRTEYIVASCLYLQCRYEQSDKMLIDFSERLSINVFELGATYLKLRSTLQLKDPIPDVDPAHYNIRFAHRLDFGSEYVNRVAADATRLVRRFRADWMTQGRRPAGVCGACMIIAARMSGFLRTPEEVSQVVKVSAVTIRKRLIEFSKTQMAGKTVKEWRELEDEQLDVMTQEEEPPIVRENRRREELAAEKARVQALRLEGFEGDEDGEENEEGSEQEDGEEGEDGEEQEDGRQLPDDTEEDEDEDARPKKRGRPSKKAGTKKGRGHGQIEADEDVEGAIQAVAEEFDPGDEEEEEVEDDDDRDLEAMEQGDFINELNQARDNPEQVAEDNAREAKAFKRAMRALKSQDPMDLGDAEFSDTDEEAEQEEDDEAEEEEEEEVEEDGEGNGKEGENEDEHAEAEDDAEGVEARKTKRKKKPRAPRFTAWDDSAEVYKYIGQTYFDDEIKMFKLSEEEVKDRVSRWLTTRDPREVVNELAIVERAKKARDNEAKRGPEENFSDLDDEELEGYYQMEEDELRLRTRVWLSNNGKWLEESKERQAKRDAYNKAHNIDPNKPKNKRKRPDRQRGPYNSAREAIENFASQKKFSSRLNYGVLKTLGLGEDEKDDGLEAMDDEKEDDEDWRDHEKHDEKEEDTGDDPNNW